jgi:hypothetical protein
MLLKRPNDLIEQRLAALPLLVTAACQAHAAIHSSSSAPDVLGIAEEVSAIATEALAHDCVCHGDVCELHTRLDQLIYRADTLLREDRDTALRALQAGNCGPLSPAQTNDTHGNIATLEGFVGIVKSMAYYLLPELTSTPRQALSMCSVLPRNGTAATGA